VLRLTAISRRRLTLIIAGAGVVISLALASLLPVPYVILSPGPTLNTLGALPGGEPLIKIAGHPTYRTSGHLNLVTVSYQGGPSNSFNVFTALQAWLSPHEAVVPEAELFTPGQTQEQVTHQDTQEMVGSQETAQAAALCQLGIKFDTIDTVTAAEKGMPAAGVLRPGDVITAVDGTPVTCRADAGVLIRRHPPHTPVVLTIERHGATKQVRLTTADVGGKAAVGVYVDETYKFPFEIKINVGEIGGPSAGLMFALAIMDKLSGKNLAHGRFIAGTGEIAGNGAVSPIGGIQQKMAGARDAGATIFLTPAANCSDTTGAVPAGLRLVKVSSLGGAVADLNAIAAGKSVPSC
jgi:Lon-like protease